MRNYVAAAACIAVLGGLATAASAATDTKILSVSASVAPSCTFTGGTLDFGTYSNAQVDVSGALTANCIVGTTYTIALDAGSTTGATVAVRKLSSGAGTIDYALFRDSARTQNWGTSTGTDTLAGTGTGSAQSVAVYGRIAAGLNPTAGTYADTVHATITF